MGRIKGEFVLGGKPFATDLQAITGIDAGLIRQLEFGQQSLAPKVRERGYLASKGVSLKRTANPEAQRRQWPRLPIAIPVFVRSRDEKGKDLLEFATALNISAGGALVAVRRSLPLSAQVLLEIPSAPLAAASSLPKAARNLRARTLSGHACGWLSPDWTQVLPSAGRTVFPQPVAATESCFCFVKTFSLRAYCS